jgi:hypothetical protein
VFADTALPSISPPAETVVNPPPVQQPKPEPVAGQLVLKPPVSMGPTLAGPPASPAVAASPTPRIEPGFTALPEAKPAVRMAEAAPSPPPAAKPVAPKPAIPIKKPEPVLAAKDVKAKDKPADRAKDGKADAAKPKDAKTAEAKAKDALKTKVASKAKDSEKAKEAKAKTPERYWVQVAGGANKADLPKAYSRLKEKTPKLFAGRSAWTTPLRATNRLLVGPFKTFEEAQGFVNDAGKQSVSAFSYTSPADQKVEKLTAAK